MVQGLRRHNLRPGRIAVGVGFVDAGAGVRVAVVDGAGVAIITVLGL